MKLPPNPRHGTKPCKKCGTLVDRSNRNHCLNCGAYAPVAIEDSGLQQVPHAFYEIVKEELLGYLSIGIFLAIGFLLLFYVL